MKLKTLLGMGFPEDEANVAITRCGMTCVEISGFNSLFTVRYTYMYIHKHVGLWTTYTHTAHTQPNMVCHFFRNRRDHTFFERDLYVVYFCVHFSRCGCCSLFIN
jgi:hypothetical protein